MRRCFQLLFFYLFAALLPDAAPAAPAGPKPPAPVTWQRLADGLDLAQIPLPAASMHNSSPFFAAAAPYKTDAGHAPETVLPAPEASGGDSLPVIAALRIDPARFTFTLHMASSDRARSLPDLAQRHNLAAAINASMYLPDNLTSTGHLRNATHVNNPRVVKKFGAFFVAQPKDPRLPRAALLDRAEDDWEKTLSQYSLAVQNYRLNNARGKVLWSPDSPPHSIAALSQDSDKNILFFLCREPVRPAAFAEALLRLSLGLRTIMYLEGGSQAAMLVRAGDVNRVWVGRHASGLWGTSGREDAALPNVLGVRPRAADE